MNRSLSKVGGICSILVGVSYILIGVTYFLLPADQRGAGAPDFVRFFQSFDQNPTVIMLQYWIFALGAILALSAVPAISEAVRNVSEGWTRWTQNLAYLGFAVGAISFFRAITLLPGTADAFIAGDFSTRAAIEGIGFPFLDPNGWLVFGGVGLWVLAVSIMALRGGGLPKIPSYVGIAVALLYGLTVAGNVLEIEMLISIAAGVGGIIAAPIWYIWIGVALQRSGS